MNRIKLLCSYKKFVEKKNEASDEIYYPRQVQKKPFCSALFSIA